MHTMTPLQIIFSIQTVCQLATGSVFCTQEAPKSATAPLYGTVVQPLINQSVYNYSEYLYR
jgi:hypothetical protein